MAVEVEFLKSLPFFSGLSLGEPDTLSRFIFEKKFERGEIILLEGESAEVLYFVAYGVVKVFKISADGKEQILNIVRPGESFSDVSIFDGGTNPASAQSMSPVVLYGIEASDLKVILRNYPEVAKNIIKVLAGRVRHLMSLVEDLSFRQVIGRVAKILLEYAGDGAGSGPRLTQQDMAAIAGTAREVVGRSLKALEGEGVIRLERHRVVISNQKALEEMVKASS